MFKWFRRKKTKRVDLQCVPYSKADELLKKGYEIAKEEDTNRVPLVVWLELRKPKGGGK